MPHLDGKGPEGEGSKSGRGLGQCSESDQNILLEKLGKGLGLKRKSGCGKGQGKRLKSSKSI
ncbi:hypothetical protein GQR60_02810 [Labilibaculum sp. A4]|uniref:DUF5320 domain-containing protein n=1 Tax=Labilibaculum euxinus TaxID=2686357 RepID=A0A425YFF5_9BACT|nr:MULTISPECIES: DUF5320 domain-containing protein [Labilibaculum]MBN2598209.1 DUF5320 domain-containing protein [Marinifilaceae bacterium]MDQ1770520.1 DUF5320 domain-containing protein [Labilibaculum euxinus]MUP38698.1 hypothetical protein [Labilibaculum euxinus]MVB07903.1 hypothetical protein [Labilibaculum euxinus]MWN75261.1 hypothetical protein [Labilibaculum euxinus]